MSLNCRGAAKRQTPWTALLVKKNVRCTTVNGKQERAEDEVASRIGYTLFASRFSRIQDEVENDGQI